MIWLDHILSGMAVPEVPNPALGEVAGLYSRQKRMKCL